MHKPLKLLVVEDSADDAEMIVREFRRAGYDPQWERVETEGDFISALKSVPDLIVSDFSMPQFSGIKALKLLHQHSLDIPFILVSGTVGEEAAVEAMHMGATDYLLKDRIVRLGNAVGRALEEKRLRDERKTLEQLLILQGTALNIAADGIMITDGDGRILWVNPAFTTTTGYSLKEAIGQTPRLLKSGTHDADFYRKFWKTISVGKTWRGEFVNRRKDGSIFYDAHTITPVRSQGKITHYIALMEDVTDRKMSEESARLRQQIKIQHQEALLGLASHEKTEFTNSLQEILKTDALTLGVGRVSYWSIHDNPKRIVCLALYKARTDKWESGIELLGTGYPRYFEALQTSRVIAVEDAQTDSRTSEFTESYLKPHEISSMLDVGVWLRGSLVGVVCHEHLGDRREWTAEDQGFATSISHMVSLALGEQERKAAEDDLRNTKRRLRHVVSSSPASTYQLEIRDHSFVPVWVSENISELTGYQPAEALSPEWWGNNLHPEDHDRSIGELDKLYEQEKLVQEYRFRRHDGNYFWARDERRMLRDSTGKPLEVIGSWSDITERKQAEAIKEALSRRNESFVRALGEIVYDHDVQSGNLEWGGDTVKCIGYSVADLDGNIKAWSDRVHPDDLSRVRSQFETLAIETLFICEYRFRHKDGHYIWVFDRGVMTRNTKGQITRVIGIMWDITNRKRAEEILRENEERFRQMTENIQEVFWMTDTAKHQIIYISPGYEKIWGRSTKELYASPQNWVDAIHAEDRERVMTAALSKQTTGSYDETYRILRPDGSTRWIRDRAFPVRDANDIVYRVAGIAEDITEQRKLEEQFRQVQKMEAVGQLAGGVAHDFNNLLTVIRGGSELLLTGEKSISRESEELLNQIILAADRATNLTRQLLVFSRKQVVQTREINVNELMENLTKMLRRMIGEDIRLKCQLAPNLPNVLADAGMLEQVLMNLVVNARDAMPGGGELIVRTSLNDQHRPSMGSEDLLQSGNYVCLSIADKGTGIPAEILPHIFEPFFTTKEEGKGTGLGLATVYGIVQQHRGWVNVESKVGEGTTFHIGIPATKKGSKSMAEPAQKLSETRLPRGTETILLVEDESSVRTLVRNVFERHGYTVLEADSGKTALAIWREHHSKIDLMLTDMVMPDGITGAMLAEQLRKERPGLKIIFNSGYSPESITKNLILAPGKNFLQKPYNPQNLLQAVRDCLDGKLPGRLQP